MVTKQEYKCPICYKSCKTKQNLKDHEDSIHKNIKFDCLDCSKQYKQKKSFDKTYQNSSQRIEI